MLFEFITIIFLLQDDQYDYLVNDVLQSMVLQDSPDVNKCNLEILIMLFQSMQIKMAKFLPLIISALDTQITVGVAADIANLSIKVYQICPQRRPYFISWVDCKLCEGLIAALLFSR